MGVSYEIEYFPAFRSVSTTVALQTMLLCPCITPFSAAHVVLFCTVAVPVSRTVTFCCPLPFFSPVSQGPRPILLAPGALTFPFILLIRPEARLSPLLPCDLQLTYCLCRVHPLEAAHSGTSGSRPPQVVHRYCVLFSLFHIQAFLSSCQDPFPFPGQPPFSPPGLDSPQNAVCPFLNFVQ